MQREPLTQLALWTVLVAGLALAPPALAANTYYAGPNGSGMTCTQVAPCTINDALGKTADGDEVVLLPGDYGSPNSPLTDEIEVNNGVYMHGQDGQPMPRIFTNQSPGVVAFDGDALLSHFAIEQSGVAGDPALVLDSGTASGIYAHSTTTGAFPIACSAYTSAGASRILNSVCWSSSPNGWGFFDTAGGGGSHTPTLRNVTAIASGAGGVGLEADADNGATVAITAINVIAKGTTDVKAVTSGAMNPAASVAFDHSNFATTDPQGAGATITAPTQVTPPLFVNAAAGDFRELAGSPTIDAGVSSLLNGPFDPDGNPRVVGASTDIGAYEFVPQGAQLPPPVTPPDQTAPVLQSFALSNTTFAAAGRGGSIAARKRRALVGTRVSYGLSEAATVTFTVQRARPGRRSGKRCGKPTRRNRAKKRCTRWVGVRGSFQHQGAVGANQFRFTGRLRNRKLAPARYRLVSVPTDAAGNKGKRTTRKFRIVRR
ncbi:MAG TPA: choice-of-anchor Q domain-containing protein [Thermoleophilaceae bacterium]